MKIEQSVIDVFKYADRNIWAINYENLCKEIISAYLDSVWKPIDKDNQKTGVGR